MAENSNGADAGIVVFRGMQRDISAYYNEWAFLRDELLRISRPEHLVGLAVEFSGGITMHVRLGDFVESASEQ